eukprot:2942782-Amphidinium_carterae.1
MDETLRSRYDCKSGGVLGPDSEDDTEVTYLNKVIRYVSGSGMQEVQRRTDEPALEPADCTRYRSGVMRIAYLSLDRPGLAHAVKCRQIPAQPQVPGERLQQTELARQGHSHGGHETRATFSPRSDCPPEKLSTTGACRLWDSSGNIGQRSRARGSRGLEDFSDSSAARAFAQCKGLGRQKHVHVRWLWVQDQVLAKEATVDAVNTAVNVADALTKPLASTTMSRHLKSMGFDFRQS